MAQQTSPFGGVGGTGTTGILPIWATTTTLGNSIVSQATTTVTLTAGVTSTNTGWYQSGSINDFFQTDIQNTSTGTSAQTTVSLTADNGTATTVFMSININNSTFTAVNAYSIGTANDTSLLASANKLYIANASNSQPIIFSTGKALTPFFDTALTINNISTGGGGIVSTQPFFATGTICSIAAVTQDAIQFSPRAGGTSSFIASLTTTTLTASRTFTFPDVSGTIVTGTLSTANRLDSTSAFGVIKESQIADAVTGNVLTIAGTLTAPRTITFPDAAVTIPSGTLLTGSLSNANRLDSTSSAGIVKESQIADAVTGNVLSITATLTAARTWTAPDRSLTLRGVSGSQTTGRLSEFDANGDQTNSNIQDAVTGNVLTLAGTLTSPRTATFPDKAGTVAMTSDLPSVLGWNRPLQEFSGPATLIGGYTWTARTLPSTVSWQSGAYGNSIFVAIANATAAAASSPDGVTWTARSLPSVQNWSDVAYGNGVFAVVSTLSSNASASSPDGINWTARTLPSSSNWGGIVYGNGVFVAFVSGTTAGATSPDGITWTARTLPLGNWNKIAYGNGTFVIISNTSTAAITSPDGVTWTARTLPSAASWAGITYGNGVFVIVAGAASNSAASSPDGVTWTARTLPSSSNWISVAYGNGNFVAVSSSVTSTIASSPDGVTWTARTNALTTANSIFYGNGTFALLASGSSNTAATSGGSLTFAGNFTAPHLINLPDADITLTAGTSIAGSIANTQVAVGSGTNTVAGSSSLTFTGGTLAVTGAGTFSTGVSTTGSTAFVLGLISSGSSNSTSAGNFPAASFRNLDVTNNNGAALFFQSYDTSSTVRTGAGISATFTAKGASTLDGILAFYTAITGTYGERSRISAAGNFLVGTTADTGLTGAGGLRVNSSTSASSSIVGAVVIGDAATAATNVGIGGGNINAGGSLKIGTIVVVGVDPGGTDPLRVGGNLFASGALTVGGNTFLTGALTGASSRVIKNTSVVTAAGTTTGLNTDHFICFTGTTTQIYTLPAASAGRRILIKNRSTGAVTVNRAGSDTIDGLTTLNVPAGASTDLVANGTDWCIV